jgi:hypothetical protein
LISSDPNRAAVPQYDSETTSAHFCASASHFSNLNLLKESTMAEAILTPPSDRIIAKLGGFSHPAVLLSCGRSFEKLHVVNDILLAQAFCRAWTCKPLQKNRPPTYAICHLDGVVRKIYKDLKWSPVLPIKPPVPGDRRPLQFDLWQFSGNETPELAHLVGLDLREELTQRGMANPVRYLNCD